MHSQPKRVEFGRASEMMANNDFRFVGRVARQHRRRSVVRRSSRHQHRPRRAHVLVTHAVQLSRSTQLTVAATHQSASTTERVDEPLAKLGAHETVRDRVAAGRHERQQVDVVHGDG